MDLHQLQVFQATVKSGGFTRAGDELHLSQSTVSQHIKLLEEELGCPLFLRVGKRVLVTEAGHVLFQYAERIFRDVKNAEMALREIGALKRGTVRLGVGPTTLTYRLPYTLSEYTRRFPDIELVVLSGTTEFLLECLREQQLDLAVVMSTVPQPGLTVTPLGLEELVLIVNKDHPFAERDSVEPSDLSSLRFILYGKNSAMQRLINQYFESLGVLPRITMEVENNEAIKSLVRIGLGASIIPLCAVANDADCHVKMLRIKGTPLMRKLCLVSPDAEILPNAIRQLASLVAVALK
jgi:LysR family transcriptional regulator, cyn operon transcriptional activator